MRILPSLLILAAAASPVLWAEDGGKPAGEHPKHEQGKGDHGPGERQKKFDTNGDGKLDDAEKAAARAAFGEKLKKEHPEAFAKIDTNGDGVLSEEEAKAGREKMKEMRDKMKAQADANGDGKVDDAEREAFKEKMKKERGGEGKGDKEGKKKEHGKKAE